MASSGCIYTFKGKEYSEKEFKSLLTESILGGDKSINAVLKKTVGSRIEDYQEMIGITHKEMDNTAKELGLETYEKDPEKIHEWDLEAKERLANNNDSLNNLFDKLRSGGHPDKIETRMMIMYMADLKAKYNKNPNSEILNKIKRAKDLFNIAGREQGKSFRARQDIMPVEETLSDFHLKDIEYNKNAPLTEKQLEQSTKEYEEISAAKKALDEKVAKLEIENAKLKAEKEIKKQSITSQKIKKVHGDFVNDRKKITESISEKLKKARGETNAIIVPYAKELIAITPDVLKLVKSYVEEGVVNLAEIVKKVHLELKDHISDIKEKDVVDIIAGEYSEKKKPRNKIVEQVFDLKRQAQLMNKLQKLLAGEEPKSEEKKVRRNREIEDLKNQIKDFEKSKTEIENKKKEAQKEEERLIKEFEKEIDQKKKAKLAEDVKRQKNISKELEKKTPEESALQSLKTRMANDIAKLENDLKIGNFEKEEKQPLKLDKEAIVLKDKFIKLKQDREVRLLKQQYENRSKFEKFKSGMAEVLNAPRSIMSSMDFSAPLRQGLIPTVSHPSMAAKAAIEMFKQSVSQNRFDRWFYDLRESPQYKIMDASGLYVADPHNPYLSVKEEAFMNNISEKIPIIGRFIKGSERAYVSYLNKMRVDLFSRGADLLESQGKTIDNSKKEYEALANWVNNSTGRGNMGKTLENAAPFLNGLFFSPRLIASRLNILNPLYYSKLPKNIRVEALKDIAKFIGFGVSVLALSKLGGAEVEDDPRSSDFGKMKIGDTRYDIWGGLSQYIRVASQLLSGQKKSTNTGKIQELNKDKAFSSTKADVATSFFRGKLAPIPSFVWDFLSGKNAVGEKFSLKDEAESRLLPLIYSDVKDAMKDEGVKALFTVGVPAMFGVGVQNYKPKQKNAVIENNVKSF